HQQSKFLGQRLRLESRWTGCHRLNENEPAGIRLGCRSNRSWFNGRRTIAGSLTAAKLAIAIISVVPVAAIIGVASKLVAILAALAIAELLVTIVLAEASTLIAISTPPAPLKILLRRNG